MAIHLKDLIESRQALAKKEDKPTEQERISIDELKKLSDQGKEQNEVLTEVSDTLKKGLTETNAPKSLNGNMEKLVKEVKKQGKSMDGLLNATKKADKLSMAAMKDPMRKGLGEKLAGFKELFTGKGILRAIEEKATKKGGILGGIVSNIAGKKADTLQRAEDIMTLNPKMSKKEAAKEAEKQIKLGEQAKKELRASKLPGIMERNNLEEEDIAQFHGGRKMLGEKIATSKKLEQASVLSLAKTAQKEQTSKVEKQEKKATAVKEEKETKIEKRQEVSAMDFSDEGQIETNREIATQTDLLTKIEENTRSGDKVADKSKKAEEGGGGMLGAMGKGLGSLGAGLAKLGRGLGKGLQVALRGLAQGLAALANPATLVGLGALTLAAMGIGKALEMAAPAIEAFAPVLIKIADVIQNVLMGAIKAVPDIMTAISDSVVSIVSGISDAIINVIDAVVGSVERLAVIDGGNLLKVGAGLAAIGAGFVALSAGGAVAGVTNLVSGFLNAVTGGKSPIDQLKEIAELGPNLEKAGLGIEKLSAGISKFDETKDADKKIAKMKDKAKTAAATAPAPVEANAVYGKSAENATTAADNKQAAPVIVNAPTSINNSKSSQNIAMPAPIRNTDSGFSGYLRKAAIFV